MRRRIVPIVVGLAGACLIAAGQNQPSSQAVQVKRTPSPAKPPIQPAIQNYDFAGQLRTLEGGDDGASIAAAAASVGSGDFKEVPKDFQLRTDTPLTPTAQEAVRVSEKWRGETLAPAAGADGRVVYAYGAGLPTVVCTPLRVCMVELQAGERIVGEPHIGDSVRWHISPAMYGSGEQATSVIVLKPQVPGLDTNLLITTDRRAYYLRLVSKPEDYVARVAFEYPDDDSNRRWQQHELEQQIAARQAQRSVEVLPAMIAVEKMNFDYKVKGGDEHIRPVRVFDDGAKTFIQMPAEIQHREAPVLVVIGTDGKGEMTNYRVKDQTYIVDRLFDRANLVLGSGKKAQKVEITRGTKG
jgi:P-type conjugative transfer protein TrbG